MATLGALERSRGRYHIGNEIYKFRAQRNNLSWRYTFGLQMLIGAMILDFSGKMGWEGREDGLYLILKKSHCLTVEKKGVSIMEDKEVIKEVGGKAEPIKQKLREECVSKGWNGQQCWSLPRGQRRHGGYRWQCRICSVEWLTQRLAWEMSWRQRIRGWRV